MEVYNTRQNKTRQNNTRSCVMCYDDNDDEWGIPFRIMQKANQILQYITCSFVKTDNLVEGCLPMPSVLRTLATHPHFEEYPR